MSLQIVHLFRECRYHNDSQQEKKSKLGIQECGINGINKVNTIYYFFNIYLYFASSGTSSPASFAAQESQKKIYRFLCNRHEI